MPSVDPRQHEKGPMRPSVGRSDPMGRKFLWNETILEEKAPKLRGSVHRPELEQKRRSFRNRDYLYEDSSYGNDSYSQETPPRRRNSSSQGHSIGESISIVVRKLALMKPQPKHPRRSREHYNQRGGSVDRDRDHKEKRKTHGYEKNRRNRYHHIPNDYHRRDKHFDGDYARRVEHMQHPSTTEPGYRYNFDDVLFPPLYADGYPPSPFISKDPYYTGQNGYLQPLAPYPLIDDGVDPNPQRGDELTRRPERRISSFRRRPQNQKLTKRVSVNRFRKQSRLQSQRELAPHKMSSTLSLMSGLTLSKLPEAFKDGPRVAKWMAATISTKEFSSQGGVWRSITKGEVDMIRGKSIERGIEKFRANPKLLTGMIYPTEMLADKWEERDHQYTYVYRDGTTGFEPRNVQKNGKGNVTILVNYYQPLPSFGDRAELPAKFRDKYTDMMKFQGTPVITPERPGLLPGRGVGLVDEPTLKIIGEVEPSDIAQGQIGNCWLLSGIASLAEFDGAVERLFRKTKNLEEMPFADGRPNMYTITLWDLKTWTEVDIVVDERLPQRSDGMEDQCMGAKPSKDGELWVCYLEKAIAAHCGGYEKIDGGRCTHAWSLMTGTKEQYVIQRDKRDPENRYGIFGKYNPTTGVWSAHENAPGDGNNSVWKVPWPKPLPELGNDTSEGQKRNLDNDELFIQLCAWEDENFLIAASTKGTSDKNLTNGLVDNHAYSVLDCRDNVADSGVDMIQVRNPWGRQEIERGTFNQGGKGWQKYPQIKTELGYTDEDDQDDGVFWLTKAEFFDHFETVWLGATDMSKFVK